MLSLKKVYNYSKISQIECIKKEIEDFIKGYNVKNIKLEKNPNDKSPAFVKPKPEMDKVNNFKKKEKGWFFSKKDKEKINKIKKSNKKRTAQHGLIKHWL